MVLHIKKGYRFKRTHAAQHNIMAAPRDGDVCTADRKNKELNSLPHGERKFYQLPESSKETKARRIRHLRSENPSELLRYIDENVIGRNFEFASPWGLRTSK